MSATTSNEAVVYQDGNSFVSTARIVVAGTTFSTANVTSVRVENRHNGIGAILIGAVIALIGLVALFNNAVEFGIGALVVGGLIFAVGTQQNFYYLVLHSASGEVRALQSRKAHEVKAIADAISEAIVMRG